MVTSNSDHERALASDPELHPFEKPSVKYSLTAVTSGLYAVTGLVFLGGTLQWLFVAIAVANLAYFPRMLRVARRMDEEE